MPRASSHAATAARCGAAAASPCLATRPIRRDGHAASAGAAGTPGCPVAPVMGEGVSAIGRQSYCTAAARTSSSHDARGRPGRAPARRARTSSRPASNCGFTRATTSAVGRRRAAARPAGCARSEMNETSMVMTSNGPGRSAGVRIPRVDVLADGHARVGAQPPVELSVSDVERDDVPRAALQQDVGESPGRRADVEREPCRSTSMSNVSSACASFSRRGPRTDGPARRATMSAVSSTAVPAFTAGDPFDAHLAGQDQRARALSRRREAARDEQDIKALAHCACWVPSAGCHVRCLVPSAGCWCVLRASHWARAHQAPHLALSTRHSARALGHRLVLSQRSGACRLQLARAR